MDKKSVLLSLWQKFVNRFYKSGVMMKSLQRDRGSKRGIRFLKRNSWLKV